MKLMDTFIRWFILLLSYRKINYGSSGVKRVGIEGTYENNSYAITQSETRSYSIEDDAITFTYAAGTDSAEVETGIWSISGDILTMSVAGDSSCTNFTLSK